MDFVHQESKAEISQKVKGENILNNWSIFYTLTNRGVGDFTEIRDVLS